MVEIIKGHWFGIVIAIVVSLSLGFQIWQLYRFMNQGARFTAQDGQQLCERIATLERHSIGFQHSVVVSEPCDYLEKR